MKLGKYSRARFLESVYLDGVVSGFWHSPALYLLYGIEAGSFFTAVLANDFFGAMTHSHPSNSVNELKKLVIWIRRTWPEEAYGSYDKVRDWIALSEEEKRGYLVKSRLIYTEDEELVKTLKGDTVYENFPDMDTGIFW